MDVENRMVLDGEWEPIPIKVMVRRDPEDELQFDEYYDPRYENGPEEDFDEDELDPLEDLIDEEDEYVETES